jgi:hypothetical protein
MEAACGHSTAWTETAMAEGVEIEAETGRDAEKWSAVERA